MDIHKIYEPFLRHFRTKRMAAFCAIFEINNRTRIIDIGGSEYNWTLIDERPLVTMVNIGVEPCRNGNLTLECGDARALKYKDLSFDVAYSNSVIEHVGGWGDQERFAAEMRRVAPNYYVQTPYRYFLIEPHLLSPFIHFLPRRVARKLIRHCTIWGLVTKPTQSKIDEFCDNTRLLTISQMRVLFPDAQIVREKFLGLTKSIIAIKRLW